MVGICFHFEDNYRDVYSGRQIDLDAWRYVGKGFGVSDFAMIDCCSGGANAAMMDTEVAFEKFDDFQSFLAAKPGIVHVQVEPSWAVPDGQTVTDVDQFTHPSGDVWYCFGYGASNFTEGVVPDHWVSIPMCKPLELHSVHSVGIVLHDRFVKLGKPGAV